MTTYGDLIATYRTSRSVEARDEMWQAVRSASNFTAEVDFRHVDRLVRRAHDAEVVRVLQEAMPGALLSPGTHMRLSVALSNLGRHRAASGERGMADLALKAIGEGGDGTRSRPYAALRVRDEYDFLEAVGRTPRRQFLVRAGGRTLDRHECVENDDVYFDVSALVPPRRVRAGLR